MNDDMYCKLCGLRINTESFDNRTPKSKVKYCNACKIRMKHYKNEKNYLNAQNRRIFRCMKKINENVEKILNEVIQDGKRRNQQ